MSLTACRTKKVTVAKTQTIQQSEVIRKLDSLVSLSTTMYQQIQTHSLLTNTRFELRTEKDENGKPQPLEYTYEVDGKVKEKITLKGGSLSRSKDTKSESSNKTISEEKAENNIINLDSKNNENQSVETYAKNKQIESKGFGFGWYVGVGIVVVVLAILAFLKWRLKLF